MNKIRKRYTYHQLNDLFDENIFEMPFRQFVKFLAYKGMKIVYAYPDFVIVEVEEK